MKKKTIKVVAAIIRKDNTVLATQRGYGDYKDWWEFPGGKIEPGETPEAALAREIKEELDSEIAVEQYLTTVEHDYPEFHLSMDSPIRTSMRTQSTDGSAKDGNGENRSRMNVLTGQKIETGTYCSHLQNRFRTNGWES